LYDQNDIPQSEPLNDRQVANNAGGYTFALDIWARLDRFLILGSDSSTYYQSSRKLTRENAAGVNACWAADPQKTAHRIADISQAGRAPKNSPAIFALALGELHESVTARSAARGVLARVCRTASHLFEYTSTVMALGRGWGRGNKRAVANWYEGKETDKLAFQMIKYRSRNDYDHSRLLRTARPNEKDVSLDRAALFAWATGRNHDTDALPTLVRAHLAAMATENASELIPLIEANSLPWEAIPTWALKNADVWRAMLPFMGMTALIRNLGTLTELNVLAPLGSEMQSVVGRLTDREALAKARIHPFTVLNALSNYAAGKGLRGDRTWKPLREVKDALDDAFYAAFDTIVPTGKRYLHALDVSGSMGNKIMNSRLSAREAAAAMCMVTVRSEPWSHVVGFTHRLVDLDVSPKMRLDRVVKEINRSDFGSTDCAKPMVEALKKGWQVDTFIVYTDNETHYGRIHPAAALKQYRKETGIDAKLIVVGMTATDFTIADPEDAGMMDVVGFDDAAPALMADFARN
jgi:60 kDa SS-A/Ro ribonucleoprotein